MRISGGRQLLRSVAIGQGVYYLLTGLWPLVSMGTFLLVTGPKEDLWLVRTVAVLVAVVGLTLLLAGLRRRVTGEIMILGVGSALALASIDVVHVARGVIPPIYLLDAVLEAALLVAWAFAALRTRAPERRRRAAAG